MAAELEAFPPLEDGPDAILDCLDVWGEFGVNTG